MTRPATPGLALGGLPVLAAAGLAVWVAKLLGVRRGVGRAARFWSVPQGEAGGLLYVALGDSTAQGVGASRPERGYVGLLARRLCERTGAAVQVVNLSRSGARLEDLLTHQLPRLAALRPDLVTVGIGGNDLLADDACTYAQQVRALTAALPRGTVVADAPYLMHGHWERDAVRAADVLTRSARGQDLVVVPLHDALRREGWSAMATQFAADFFHPNDRGHRVWAEAFWGGVLRAPVAARLRTPTRGRRPAR